jgi:hypothetical protein
MTDWTTDLLFKPEVTMIKRFTKYAKEKADSSKRAKNHCKSVASAIGNVLIRFNR